MTCRCGKSTSQSLWIFPRLFRSTFVHKHVVTVSLASFEALASRQCVPDVAWASNDPVILQQMWCLFEVTVALGFYFSRHVLPDSCCTSLHLLECFSSSLDCFFFPFTEGMWFDYIFVSALRRTWTKWLVCGHFCSFIAETSHWIYCMIECKKKKQKKKLYSCLFYMSNSWYM